jgi:hypothetical protein
MRQTLKLLHELGAAGLIGTLAAYFVLVAFVPVHGVADYAVVRASIAALSKWLLMPSLAVVLISGLLAIAAHRPFMEARWVWVKALLGLSMFEGTLGAVAANAQRGTDLSARALAGSVDPTLMKDLAHSEWIGLSTIAVLAIANIVLAVWRPRLRRRIS